MAGGNVAVPGSGAARGYGSGSGGYAPGNLGDILERVLDKGLVIAGDIRVNLLDIELLTIKLRLVIASVQTAKELGIDWWENDPWLTSGGSNERGLAEENRRLRDRIATLEAGGGSPRALGAARGDVPREGARGGARAQARGDDGR